MSAKPKPTMMPAQRASRGGSVPGIMPPTSVAGRTAATGKATQTTPSATPGSESAEAPTPAARKPAPARTKKAAAQVRVGSQVALGFGGQRKMAVSMRTYPSIWEAYNDLAGTASRESGGRVYQGDLVNALLALRVPSGPDEVFELLAEYRQLLESDPPADFRSL